ncbi:efflux RND transporter periplasmic adaptor subunit [Candidatus Peregrinibacteria bacterium]|nr:efflux RND transporter periplasmic adaptor subunit [Candidatus Peregrinibacteria bacterium]
MKIKLPHLIIGLLVFTALLSAGCAPKKAEETAKEYLPEVQALTVKPGLQQEFTVTGDVFAHQISRMTAEQRGKVESVLVKEGDTVYQGQELIILSSSEVVSNFNTAASTLNNAQVGLQQTQLSAEKTVEAAEIALDTAKTNLQNTIRQNLTLKKQAEETLKSAELNLKLGVSSTQSALDNAMKNILPVVQSAVNASDKILGVSATYKFTNDSFENNLAALNSRTKSEAERALRDIQAQLSIYSASFENALTLLITTEDVLQKTLTVLNNSITGSNYTQSTLNADITSITTQLTSVRASITSLESAKRAVETASQESEGNSQSILNARAAYQTTITQLEVGERNAKQAVESSLNALENAKRSAELSRISAKSSVDSAYGVYDQARIGKNKLVIKAPFSGKVAEIMVKTGEEVNPGTLILTVEDDSVLNLVTYLSSSDVQKIELGSPVTINKNGEITTVSSIAPSADPISKKYKVEMEHQSDTLKAGEAIKLTFRTGEELFNHGRLFIPLPALHILPNELFVWKLENRQTVKAPVTVGEVVGEYVEVLEGLEAGDDIITEGGRLIEEEGVSVNILNRPAPKIPKEN